MSLFNVITIICGVCVDLIFGDPSGFPHPVVGLGKAISWMENWLNRPKLEPMRLRIYGIITVLLTLIIAFGAVFLILRTLSPYPWLFWTVNSWLMGTTIARKGLCQAARLIYELLIVDDLDTARKEVGKIVGRDTVKMTRTEIIRATVESVAENSVDGVIAPLFYGLIGGVPLAMLYRAVNTLDSMLGYKNERYQFFGWAAARLDDLANLIPARICAILMIICCWILGFNWRGSVRIAWRDAGKHPSPNGGWPEAVLAGALGVRLGGTNYYQGLASFRSYLGETVRQLETEDIKSTVRILNATTIITLIVFSSTGIIFC